MPASELFPLRTVKNNNKLLSLQLRRKHCTENPFSELSSLVCEKFLRREAHGAVAVCVCVHFRAEREAIASHNESHKNLSKAQKCTRRAIKIIFSSSSSSSWPFAFLSQAAPRSEKLPSASGKLKIRRRKGARVGWWELFSSPRFFWRLSGKCFSPSIPPSFASQLTRHKTCFPLRPRQDCELKFFLPFQAPQSFPWHGMRNSFFAQRRFITLLCFRLIRHCTTARAIMFPRVAECLAGKRLSDMQLIEGLRSEPSRVICCRRDCWLWSLLDDRWVLRDPRQKASTLSFAFEIC